MGKVLEYTTPHKKVLKRALFNDVRCVTVSVNIPRVLLIVGLASFVGLYAFIKSVGVLSVAEPRLPVTASVIVKEGYDPCLTKKTCHRVLESLWQDPKG